MDAVAPSWYPDPQRDGHAPVVGRHAVDGARAAGPDGRQAGPRPGGHRRHRPGHVVRPGRPDHARVPADHGRAVRGLAAGRGGRPARARRPQRRGRADPRRAPGGGRGRVPAAQEGRRASARSRGSASSCSSRRWWPGPNADIAAPGMDGRPRDGIDRAGHAERGRLGPATGSSAARSAGPLGALRAVEAPRGVRGRARCCSASGSSSSIAVPVALPIGLLLMLAGPLAPALTLVVDVRAESRDGVRGEDSLT